MAKSQDHIVRVVLDPEFGEKLEALATGEPVWIVDSRVNTPVAQRLWNQPARHPSGSRRKTLERVELPRETPSTPMNGVLMRAVGDASTEKASNFSRLSTFGKSKATTVTSSSR